MRLTMYLIAILLVIPAVAWSQTIDAFKTGEETTGLTKQCFYEALGNAYTVTISSIQLCPLSIQIPSGGVRNNTGYSTPKLRPSGVTAFKIGEQTTGMTKQCFYNALGNVYTKTISSVELCPLSIQVNTGG